MKRHVAFVAVAEIRAHVGGPLIRFGQQHAVGLMCVECAPNRLDDGVRLRQILAVGAFALDQVRNGVEPEAIDAHVQPEIASHRRISLEHCGIVEVQIRLV